MEDKERVDPPSGHSSYLAELNINPKLFDLDSGLTLFFVTPIFKCRGVGRIRFQRSDAVDPILQNPSNGQQPEVRIRVQTLNRRGVSEKEMIAIIIASVH